MAAGTAMTLETLRVEIRAEIAKYKSDLKKAETATTTSSNAMKTALNGVKTALGAIGIVTGLMAAIAKIVQLGKESIELASDLEEVQNVVDVTFGNMSAQINEFATNAMTQFGLSQTAAKQYASTIGAVLKSMGFNGQQLVDMSTEIAGLAGDLASFYNLDTETAFAKLRSGILGETEPLKQLGINLSQANLEAFALSQGITTAYNAMSEQEKAMLRYQYILQATGDAQGDFSRTSDGWANQVRIMREQINAIKAEIGSGLMEILLPIVRGINWLLSQVIRGLQALRRFFSRGKSGTSSVDTMTDATAGLTSEANAAASAVGGIGKAAKSAAKAFTTSSFDELHQLTNPGSGGSGGSGGGGGGGISGVLDGLDLYEDETTALNNTGKAATSLRDNLQGLWDIQQKVNYLIYGKMNSPEQVAGFNAQQQAVTDAWDQALGLTGKWERFDKWRKALPASYVAAQEGLEAYNREVRNTWTNLKSKFGPGIEATRVGLRHFNEAAVSGWRDLGVALGILSDDAEDSTERVSGAFVGAQEKIAGATGSIEKKLAQLAGDQSLDTLKKNIGEIGTKATKSGADVDAAGRSIVERMRTMNTDSGKPISDLVTKEGTIGSGMTSAATTVKTGASSVVTSLKTMNSDGGKQADSLKSTITTKLNEAASSASSSGGSIKNSIVGAVNGAKSELSAQKFADLGQNIKNGVIAGMGDFKNQLNQWANQFKEHILKNFRIKSPSRWMRDEVGWYLGLGMAEGMNDSEQRILQTCDNIAAAMAGSFAGSMGSVPLGISGVSGGGWVDHMATTIAQNITAGNSQTNQQPIVCEVYLDRDRIASAVSKGQQAQNRRYSSTAMA